MLRIIFASKNILYIFSFNSAINFIIINVDFFTIISKWF